MEIKDYLEENYLKCFKSEPRLDFLSNEMLYKLFKEHPHHTDGKAIYAKVFLLGRAYASSIERRRKAVIKGDQFYEEKVIPGFVNSDLDKRIESISNFKIISEENISDILKVHKDLVQLIKKIIDPDDQTDRSFASKYLHFHLPELFFIYDSRAPGSLNTLAKAYNVEIPGTPRPQEVDEEYSKFFRKAFKVRERLGESFGGKYLTTKQFDDLLIDHANRKSK